MVISCLYNYTVFINCLCDYTVYVLYECGTYIIVSYAACILCSERSRKYRYYISMHGLYMCSQCGVLFLWNVP